MVRLTFKVDCLVANTTLNIMKRTIRLFTVLVVTTLVALPALSQPRNGDGDGDMNRNAERGMFRDVPLEVRSEAHLAVFDEYLDLNESQEDQTKKPIEE